MHVGRLRLRTRTSGAANELLSIRGLETFIKARVVLNLCIPRYGSGTSHDTTPELLVFRHTLKTSVCHCDEGKGEGLAYRVNDLKTGETSKRDIESRLYVPYCAAFVTAANIARKRVTPFMLVAGFDVAFVR